MLRETIELEVECHNGDLSQSECITSTTPLTSGCMTAATTNATAAAAAASSVALAAAISQTTSTTPITSTTATTTHSIQHQQQPILQQPQLKHPAPKLTNLPTLSISGPQYETDDIL